MRILIDKTNVREIYNIFSAPSFGPNYKPLEGTPVTNPEDFSVCWNEYNENEGYWIGSYNLDGTIKTYQEAVKNFEEVCEKLLTKGYCRMSDFKNFKWY